ncbi:MFS transporter [Ectopseudomonas mendocina]|uniref:MFS transporter n=1 Tax=Ectopseudomonas mendocina TaxID=300 RepID=A0ABZ2RKP8_ECTME
MGSGLVGLMVFAIALGALMDRYDPWRVLALAYLCGALAMWGVAQLHDQFVLLIFCVAALGMCISGSQVGANVLAASFYPTSGRATGVAWAQGVGRIGAISGTLLGGQMISVGFGFTAIFLLLAIPALLACAAVFYMGQRYRAPVMPVLMQP